MLKQNHSRGQGAGLGLPLLWSLWGGGRPDGVHPWVPWEKSRVCQAQRAGTGQRLDSLCSPRNERLTGLRPGWLTLSPSLLEDSVVELVAYIGTVLGRLFFPLMAPCTSTYREHDASLPTGRPSDTGRDSRGFQAAERRRALGSACAAPGQGAPQVVGEPD